jgi:hypothetical protein
MMHRATKKALKNIKAIQGIDFEILGVDRQDGDDVIRLKINNNDFQERLRLKHIIVGEAFKGICNRKHIYITGAI